MATGMHHLCRKAETQLVDLVQTQTTMYVSDLKSCTVLRIPRKGRNDIKKHQVRRLTMALPNMTEQQVGETKAGHRGGRFKSLAYDSSEFIDCADGYMRNNFSSAPQLLLRPDPNPVPRHTSF